MGRTIYKLLVNDIEIAIFYELKDVMIYIEGACDTYFKELESGITFTIKKEVE